jgi:lysophospholipase L1-like esterase
MSKCLSFSLLCFFVLIGFFQVTVTAEEATVDSIQVKKGEKIAFLGDSITAAGRKAGGYCQLVLDGLKAEGLECSAVFAGISGHKSNQMLARLEKDVLSKKPDWMTLSCGVNDVWHGKRGVNLEDYKKNITAIVEKAQAAGVKVMILTSTMIKEDQKTELNQKLAPYNAFLKDLAVSKKCLFADLNTEMQEALKQFPADAPKGKQLTGDGVHMNAYGNHMMAIGVLKAFGLSAEKIPALVNKWKDISNNKRMHYQISINEADKIKEKLGKSVDQALKDYLEEIKK